MTHDMKITTCGSQVIILFDPRLIEANRSGVWPSWADRIEIEKLTNCVIEWDIDRRHTDISQSIGFRCYLIAYDIIKNNNKKIDREYEYTEDELIEIARSITTGPEGIA